MAMFIMITKKNYQAVYYQRNKERIAERERQKYLEARQSRRCVECSQPCVDFKYKKYCSESCQKEGNRKYQTNYKREAVKEFATFKLTLGGCSKCGYNADPAALDFHHTQPEEKEWSPASLKSRNPGSFKSILIEGLATRQLELLCANCHRIETRNARLSKEVQ